MTPLDPIPPAQREMLLNIRNQLLPLHKMLLDLQRAEYEENVGRIASTGEFLNLVISNEQFAWLRQLSGAIVEIDELLAPRSKGGCAEADAILDQLRALLIPVETGAGFQRKYWDATQKSVDVIFAHREIELLLK